MESSILKLIEADRIDVELLEDDKNKKEDNLSIVFFCTPSGRGINPR